MSPSRAGRGAQGSEPAGRRGARARPPGPEDRGRWQRVPRGHSRRPGHPDSRSQERQGRREVRERVRGREAGLRRPPEPGALLPLTLSGRGPQTGAPVPTHGLRRAPRAAGRPEGVSEAFGGGEGTQSARAQQGTRVRADAGRPQSSRGPFTIKPRAGRPRRPPEGGPAPIKTYC